MESNLPTKSGNLKKKASQAQSTHEKSLNRAKSLTGLPSPGKKGQMLKRYKSNRRLQNYGNKKQIDLKLISSNLRKQKRRPKRPKHVKQRSQNNLRESQKLKSEDELKKATSVHCIQTANDRNGKRAKSRHPSDRPRRAERSPVQKVREDAQEVRLEARRRRRQGRQAEPDPGANPEPGERGGRRIGRVRAGQG